MTEQTNPPDDDPGFVTLPLVGPWENPQASDPKSLRVRKDVYVEDMLERDFFEAHQEQAWSTALVARLANVSDGVLRRCSHGDSLRIAALADVLTRHVVPDEFEETDDGRTKIALSKPLRPAREDERKQLEPEHVHWRPLFNRDLIQSEIADGEFSQNALLVSQVTGVAFPIVKRFHLADWLAIREVLARYRKKEEAVFP